MPPGPRKRRRQRQTETSPGFSISADESHESDETTSCPDTPDQGKLTISPLDTPSDQKFQTEEWVRISHFDLGTPTSTTADSKADYGVVALDGYGDVRGHDKLADWETVSRDMGGISSSEDAVENMQGDDSVVDESVGPSQGQGLELPHVENGNLERLSGKQAEYEKASSSRTSEAQEKMNSIFEAGSPSREEDQEAASTVEFQENVQFHGGSDVKLQQEHDNETQESHMEANPQKLQEQEVCSNGNESLPEEQEEDHVTNSRQEDSKMIGHALEEDRNIKSMDTTIPGMDDSIDQTEALDVAALEQKDDNVKGIFEQENDEHDQLLDIAHSMELGNLGQQEEEIIAQEDKDIGENISEPIADMLASVGDLPQTLQHGEVDDLQKVAIEESPLIKECSDSPDVVVSEVAEPSMSAQESALLEQFSVSNEDFFTDAIPREDKKMLLSEDLTMTAEVEKDSPTQRIIAPGAEYHGSNGNLSCPDTPDQGEQPLSLLDTPSDRTLQTEEWVKISDFDVGTRTSTTADSRADYDIAAEKSYGNVRGHDKLADWETVSKDTVGASSIEEVEESLGDHSALEESISSSQGQGLELPHVDKGDLECLSGKRASHERVSLSSQFLSEVSENKEKISNFSEASSPGKEQDQEAASALQFQENNQESSNPEVPLQPDHDNEKEISSMDVQSQKLQVQQEPEEEHHVANPIQEDNMENSLEEGGSMQAVDSTIGGVDESGEQSIKAVDFVQHEPQEDNSKGISEQENNELDELVDIAQTTQLANLGKQEEKIIAQEEEDLGKNIVEPPANVLAAAETSSETLQLGEVEDLQNVAVEDTPLVQDSSDEPDAVVSEETEPSSRGQESALVENSSADSFTDAIPGEYENTHLPEELATAGHTSQIDAPLAEMDNYNLIQRKTAPGPQLPMNFSTARTDDLGKGLSIGGSGSSPEDLVHYHSPKKSEGQLRSREHWDGSSEISGCCEPVHWILVHFFGRQIN